MPVTYAPHVYPAAGDPVLGCKHEPDPWSKSTSCHLFAFKRPERFSGLRRAEVFGVFVELLEREHQALFFIACDACGKAVHACADSQPEKMHECIADLAGVFGEWPANAPRVHFLGKDVS